MGEGGGEFVRCIGEEEGHFIVLDWLPGGSWRDAGFKNSFAVWIGGCDETLDIWKAVWEAFSLWSRHLGWSFVDNEY